MEIHLSFPKFLKKFTNQRFQPVQGLRSLMVRFMDL